MPESSSPRKFIKSLRTGTTDITKALALLFKSPNNIKSNAPLWAELQAPNGLHAAASPHLRPEAKAALIAAGLGPKKRKHIGEWPPDQKELVRRTLVSAINTNRRIHFFWELHGGEHEVTDIKDDGKDGDLTIIFRSPQRNVSIDAAGDIQVKVGRK